MRPRAARCCLPTSSRRAAHAHRDVRRTRRGLLRARLWPQHGGHVIWPARHTRCVHHGCGACRHRGAARVSGRVEASQVHRHAARVADRFVYDPNYRPRLTGAADARELLAELAPDAWLITPSHPGETSALLGVDSAAAAAERLRELGTEIVAVTCGASGVQVVAAGVSAWVPSVPAPAVVDQTGAGDAYVGTLTARLVLGDDLVTAARLAAAASSLVVGGRGGTGLVPTLAQTRAHLATAPASGTEEPDSREGTGA